MHFLLQQVSPLPQVLPQMPQFSVVVRTLQLPEQQYSPAPHREPQLPQLFSSDLMEVQVPSHGIAPGPQAVTYPVVSGHCPAMHEPELHSVPQLPQLCGSVITLVMTPLQGTGCSEEPGGGGLPPRNELKNVPMEEKNDGGALSEGTGVVVLRWTSGTGPSDGRSDTSAGTSSDGGREVITGSVPSAGTGLTMVTEGTA
jgi:hypothetical protein